MCKKIISFFQRTPGLPAVAVSVVFLVIYLFGSCIFKNISQKEITEGLDGIGIIANIAIALALLEITIRIGYGQIKVQRDNIKIQMFDKRYAVYEAIADSLDIAMRKDYSDFVLSGMIDLFAINKLINDANSNLMKQTLLSQSLFEKNVYSKIRDIRDEFNKITKLHFKSYKENIKLSEKDKVLFAEFGELFTKTTFATTDEEMAKYNGELEVKFPDIYKTIKEFNTAVDGYAEFVKMSGVLTDFNQYLIIHNLDR